MRNAIQPGTLAGIAAEFWNRLPEAHCNLLKQVFTIFLPLCVPDGKASQRRFVLLDETDEHVAPGCILRVFRTLLRNGLSDHRFWLPDR